MMKKINWPRFLIGLLVLILLSVLAKNLIGGFNRRHNKSTTMTQFRGIEPEFSQKLLQYSEAGRNECNRTS